MQCKNCQANVADEAQELIANIRRLFPGVFTDGELYAAPTATLQSILRTGTVAANSQQVEFYAAPRLLLDKPSVTTNDAVIPPTPGILLGAPLTK